MCVYDGKYIEHFEVTEEHWEKNMVGNLESEKTIAEGVKDAEDRLFFLMYFLKIWVLCHKHIISLHKNVF